MGVMPNIQLSSTEWKILVALLAAHLPNVKVWAFGSRAKLTARKNSDLDLVAFATPNQRTAIENLRDAFGESDLPFVVDLHVWENIPPHFRSEILQLNVEVQEGCSADPGAETSLNPLTADS